MEVSVVTHNRLSCLIAEDYRHAEDLLRRTAVECGAAVCKSCDHIIVISLTHTYSCVLGVIVLEICNSICDCSKH